jgi:hypothetical protein
MISLQKAVFGSWHPLGRPGLGLESLELESLGLESL